MKNARFRRVIVKRPNLRIPFLIKGPGIPAGKRTFEPAANVDLAPTILDLAGLDPDDATEGRILDGTSLRLILDGNSPVDRAILLEARRSPQRGKSGAYSIRSWLGVRTRRYTYVKRYSVEASSAAEAYNTPIGAGHVVSTELYDNERDR